jgi:RND family efflux transporter MFP subunit
MKARFANADRALWPGTFVRVSLQSQTLTDVTVIPAQAIVTGPSDKFVYKIQADDTVQPQKVEVIHIDNELAAVKGLAAGARIVVEGAQNLRPGSRVKEISATPNNTEPGGSDKKQ